MNFIFFFIILYALFVGVGKIVWPEQPDSNPTWNLKTSRVELGCRVNLGWKFNFLSYVSWFRVSDFTENLTWTWTNPNQLEISSYIFIYSSNILDPNQPDGPESNRPTRNFGSKFYPISFGSNFCYLIAFRLGLILPSIRPNLTRAHPYLFACH